MIKNLNFEFGKENAKSGFPLNTKITMDLECNSEEDKKEISDLISLLIAKSKIN